MYHPELYIQLANHSSVNLVILLYTKRGDGSHLDFEQIKTTKVWSYNVHSIVASNDVLEMVDYYRLVGHFQRFPILAVSCLVLYKHSKTTSL